MSGRVSAELAARWPLSAESEASSAFFRGVFMRLLQSRFPESRPEDWFDEPVADLSTLEGFRWSLDVHDTEAVTPDVLPDLFAAQLSQKDHGAYYTPAPLASQVCRQAIDRARPGRVLDPACGAGDMLLAALRLLNPERSFEHGRRVVEQHLFGVDLMGASLEIARLRLRLELAACARTSAELKAIPHLRINLHAGNSLLGGLTEDSPPVNQLHYEEATWDDQRGREGRPIRRPLTADDLLALQPFPWSRIFPEAMGQGGFDAIVANPPWDSFKPNAKEFFQRYSAVVSKKRMTVEQFESARTELLRDPEIRSAWLQYLSRYRTISAGLRALGQYRHQTALLDGRRTGGDTNLYKLFTERSFQLLRPDARGCLVLPGGIATDLGAKGLRELLFDQATITGLSTFENRQGIFEGVHRSFKFALLSFRKGGRTERIPATFGRASLTDLDTPGPVLLPTALIRRLAPDSLTIVELKSPVDLAIAEKMLQHPRLGERLKLGSEFHMTADSGLFRTSPAKGALPLYEGKMIWQFDPSYTPPRYWIDEQRGRQAILSKDADCGQTLDYERARLAIRAVAANTNVRSLIAAIVPARVFCGNSLLVNRSRLSPREISYLTGVLNSCVVDFLLRNTVTNNVNIFYLKQLPVPAFEAPETAQIVELTEQVGTTSDNQWLLRAEIDARTARLYGLTEAEYVHVLASFPLVPDSEKEAAVQAFQRLCADASSLVRPAVVAWELAL